MRAELIDVMGDDLRVVNAARVSFDKESEWEWDSRESGYGGERVVLKEKDQKLLNYLAKHGHWTPFSHVMITMRETVPIFVARQRFKHFVGFNTSGDNDHEGLGMTYNEVSRRYVDDAPEFYRPDEWRKRAENKKQGSSDETITHFRNEEVLITYSSFQKISEAYDDFIDQACHLYKDLINSDAAPEQARMVLPQSMYTSYYVTGSLTAWARAYKQRVDGHAQKEIQDLAKQWGDIIGGIPELKHSWNALTS